MTEIFLFVSAGVLPPIGRDLSRLMDHMQSRVHRFTAGSSHIKLCYLYYYLLFVTDKTPHPYGLPQHIIHILNQHYPASA